MLRTRILIRGLAVLLPLFVCQVQAGTERIHGTVLAADPAANRLTLKTEAGEQSFGVDPGDARIYPVGTALHGRILHDGDMVRLESIWPDDPVHARVIEGVNHRLRRETLNRGRRAYRAVGDYMPDFALYNQNGELVRRDRFRGEYLVINFIFTRCMVAEMCPASTARMVSLQRQLREEGIEGVHLVTISFDPDYDTPGVLNWYGSQRGMDFANFSLLTGDKQAIDDLMRQFGIHRLEEDGTINHTMATLLVGQNGKILFRREGSRWNETEFLQRLRELQ